MCGSRSPARPRFRRSRSKKKKERLGVVKIAVFGCGAADGKLIDSCGPQFGNSHENEKVL